MFKYVRVVLKILPLLIFEYFAWILPYSINPKKYPFEKRFKKVQKLIIKVIKAFNIVSYDETYQKFINSKDPNRNYVIFCNHMSFLDPLYFISRSKTPVTFVAKKEIEKYPFVGRIIKILDGEFLDREDDKKALRTFMNVQKKLASSTRMDIIIFPEGTRNKDPLNSDVTSFHAGTFRCALKSKCPVLIASIFGTFRASNGKYFAKYNPVRLENIKVLEYEDIKDMNTEQISEYSYQLINDDVKKAKVFDKEKMKLLNKKHIN